MSQVYICKSFLRSVTRWHLRERPPYCEIWQKKLFISMGDTGEKAMLSKVSICKNWITKYNLLNFLNKFWILINNVRCLCSTQHKTSVNLQYNTLVCRANGTNLLNFLNKFWFLINNVRCLCSTQHKPSVNLQYDKLVCRANGTNESDVASTFFHN